MGKKRLGKGGKTSIAVNNRKALGGGFSNRKGLAGVKKNLDFRAKRRGRAASEELVEGKSRAEFNFKRKEGNRGRRKK